MKTPLPDLLPGEDRSFGSGLFVDLVPRGAWFTNVRSCVAPSDWDRIRRMVYARADFTCEACGAIPTRTPGDYIEAHERWRYLASVGGPGPQHFVQRLVRLIALCTACHAVTHFGRTEAVGKRAQALAHLAKVTGMGPDAVADHVNSAFQVWTEMSRHDWDLDLSILTAAGVAVKEPPAARARRAAADAALSASTKNGNRHG